MLGYPSVAAQHCSPARLYASDDDSCVVPGTGYCAIYIHLDPGDPGTISGNGSRATRSHRALADTILYDYAQS